MGRYKANSEEEKTPYEESHRYIPLSSSTKELSITTTTLISFCRRKNKSQAEIYKILGRKMLMGSFSLFLWIEKQVSSCSAKCTDEIPSSK